jgi:hypothetical protein
MNKFLKYLMLRVFYQLSSSQEVSMKMLRDDENVRNGKF